MVVSLLKLLLTFDVRLVSGPFGEVTVWLVGSGTEASADSAEALGAASLPPLLKEFEAVEWPSSEKKRADSNLENSLSLAIITLQGN